MHTLGRVHAPEPLSALLRFHFHHREKITLREVDHEPKVAVLDQENLLEQGIRVSTFIAGAVDVDELGSCTCNTLIEALSNLLTPAEFAALLATFGAQQRPADPYSDTVAAERAAIGAYHRVTDQTGQSSSEWPPTDCGSSGPYLFQFALHHGLIKTERIATVGTPENVVSLLQTGSIMTGSPWMNAWFEPDAQGFIDGDGSPAALQSAIASGVAGGHEFLTCAVEKLAIDRLGRVDAANTILRHRNHWTSSFADNGDFRTHLSTHVMLAGQTDMRQLVA